MPPKNAQKAKAADKATDKWPSTPSKQKPKSKKEPDSDIKSEAEPPKLAATPSKKTPKKQSQTVEFGPLKRDPDSLATVSIDVSVSNEEPVAEPKKKGNGFEKLLRLESADKFVILKTFMLTEGPDEGCQAILVRPAKPFAFLKLEPEIRTRIYRFYFANRGGVDDPIQVDGKRKGGLFFSDMYAKTYSNDSKNRVGLLAVNKEVYAEAVQIFCSIPIRLDGSSSVMDFLSQLDPAVRQRITSVVIKNYQKATARTALNVLAECKNLTRVHFDSGVFSEGDPQKAAKALFGDAHKFFRAMGTAKGNKEAGVDILSFGKQALTLKTDSPKNKDEKIAKAWPDHMVNEMRESLKSKLK
ncbi:hypothetical protein CB0940_04503 [Cercospora beticola]|uniref:Uncharacterized protein n=1 Tax=Cercospora beticola TaxID=122368 RepID=A0A2G5HME7_CERBT|nr:hypothetical protein CB0940_04503 [Cercospora beticola]PIA93714.1 hypothetical protein CB0940_04503 [Cercospora beticola]WPB01752.1 hypothetical protein RHO25_006384 [Cercospora beticola]